MTTHQAPAFPVDLPSSDPEHFIHSLPKTEMHLHIEGALSLHDYKKVVDAPAGWIPDGWGPDYRYETFADFENFILGYGDKWYNSPERYHEAAKASLEAKVREGVTYMECSFGVIVCQIHGLPIDEVVDAIKSATPDGLELRLFMGCHHDSWNETMAKPLTDALSIKGLDGIDLHGPEGYPARDWMFDYWPAARAAGKCTKAHAGELGGAWHVREAVEKLGVRRIEHGFRGMEDPEVLALMKAHNVVCGVCPISNYKLKTVESYKTHPLRQMIDAGITCTINTDDPFVFGNTISDEFIVLEKEVGLTRAEIIQLARNGFEQALVDDATRTKYLSDFDAAAAKL